MDGPRPNRQATAEHRRTVAYIFPIFNEAENIELLHSTITSVTDPLRDRYDFSFLYVDDGSKDASVSKLTKLAEADDRVTVIELSRNATCRTLPG
jgi:dolichol-phosphate mannosyltransferase